MTTQISLASARVNAGYTIKEIAEEIKKTTKTISNWEKGRTAIPTEMFFILCDKYNINSDNVKVPIVNDNRY